MPCATKNLLPQNWVAASLSKPSPKGACFDLQPPPKSQEQVSLGGILNDLGKQHRYCGYMLGDLFDWVPNMFTVA